MSVLQDQIAALEPRLAVVINAIASAVAEVSEVLRLGDTKETGTSNVHGDSQLELDVAADTLIFAKLRECGAVETASSEETSEMVAFDPVDGSSIIPANFAVGSIFGIWPGGELLSMTGRDQAAACYAVYGPRTILVLSRPQVESSPDQVVQEYVLAALADASSRTPSRWELRRDHIRIGDKKVFAPANLRAAAENQEYAKLVQHWLQSRYTLRYTGGMVPDVHHITMGGGVFCNPCSASAPAKLRLLYEAAPMAFIIEAAGGASHNGTSSVLDCKVNAVEERTVICLGSKQEVDRSIPALADAH